MKTAKIEKKREMTDLGKASVCLLLVMTLIDNYVSWIYTDENIHG